MKRKTSELLGDFSTFLLSGCASNINSDHYDTSATGRVSTVSQCTVLNVDMK